MSSTCTGICTRPRRGTYRGSVRHHQAGTWGSIPPAAWSFMPAARERGLGTVRTTGNLPVEREFARALGIPYEEVVQAAFIPVAYTLGTDFRPARRIPRDQVLHGDHW
ncbi:nitroreductase family protein [Streptomyces tanashiensis]|uniref:nitroreductase family protein n=1 Tax=Streptomyces tanashiensis TaxID=67367 RepID=UPI002B3FFE8B|nr:nitroreductase family protein [Streptomyces tanashiensis]